MKWEGQWHLMQQWHARPAISVGHSVSADLLHFVRLPDALFSGKTSDQQCYDGSSSVTPRGPMLMIDGGCGFHNASTPHQSRCMESSGDDTGGITAWPEDLQDPNLTVWKKQGPTKWVHCDGASGQLKQTRHHTDHHHSPRRPPPLTLTIITTVHPYYCHHYHSHTDSLLSHHSSPSPSSRPLP